MPGRWDGVSSHICPEPTTKSLMIKEQCCMSCAYWLQRRAWIDRQRETNCLFAICDGYLYSIGRSVHPEIKAQFVFHDMKEGEKFKPGMVVTAAYNRIEKIPENMRRVLPDDCTMLRIRKRPENVL